MARHQSKKRKCNSRSNKRSKRGGDMGLIATAAVPLSLLALSKYYGSRKRIGSFSNTMGKRGRKSRRSKSWF